MKYLKRLIKRKKYRVIVFSVLWGIFSIFMIVYNLMDFINNSLTPSHLSPSFGIASIVGSSNFGLIILGLMNFYIALFLAPSVSIYAQDDSEYEILEENDNIILNYKKYSVWVKKDGNISTNLIFVRDINNKLIGFTTGARLNNYITYKFKDK